MINASTKNDVHDNHQRYRRVAFVQGLYFLVTGLWPIFHIESFLVVTGPKVDLWLAYTVGVLVAVIGMSLLKGVWKRRITADSMFIAIGSAIALAGIDLIFVTRDVISPIYLADAAVEMVFVFWWIAAAKGVGRRREVDPAYPHLQALLERGRSITPTEK